MTPSKVHDIVTNFSFVLFGSALNSNLLLALNNIIEPFPRHYHKHYTLLSGEMKLLRWATG